MSAHFTGTHEVGDIVTPKRYYYSGKERNLPEGLEWEKEYTVVKARRGIDGAIDWDDIYLEGFEESFCEFDLDHVRRPKPL